MRKISPHHLILCYSITVENLINEMTKASFQFWLRILNWESPASSKDHVRHLVVRKPFHRFNTRNRHLIIHHRNCFVLNFRVFQRALTSRSIEWWSEKMRERKMKFKTYNDKNTSTFPLERNVCTAKMEKNVMRALMLPFSVGIVLVVLLII